MRRLAAPSLALGSALLAAACGLDRQGLSNVTGDDASAMGDSTVAADTGGADGDSGVGPDDAALDAPRYDGAPGTDSAVADAPGDAAVVDAGGQPDGSTCTGSPTSCGTPGHCVDCTGSPSGTQCVGTTCGCNGSQDCSNSSYGGQCNGGTCGCSSFCFCCPFGTTCLNGSKCQ